LLSHITYFIVTVIIGFVERAANLAAAGTLVVGIECRLPARYTRRTVIVEKIVKILCFEFEEHSTVIISCICIAA